MLMDIDAAPASDFEEVDSDEAPPPPKRRGAATAKAKAPAKRAPAKKAPAKGKGKKVQVRVYHGFRSFTTHSDCTNRASRMKLLNWMTRTRKRRKRLSLRSGQIVLLC